MFKIEWQICSTKYHALHHSSGWYIAEKWYTPRLHGNVVRILFFNQTLKMPIDQPFALLNLYLLVAWEQLLNL